MRRMGVPVRPGRVPLAGGAARWDAAWRASLKLLASQSSGSCTLARMPPCMVQTWVPRVRAASPWGCVTVRMRNHAGHVCAMNEHHAGPAHWLVHGGRLVAGNGRGACGMCVQAGSGMLRWLGGGTRRSHVLTGCCCVCPGARICCPESHRLRSSAAGSSAGAGAEAHGRISDEKRPSNTRGIPRPAPVPPPHARGIQARRATRAARAHRAPGAGAASRDPPPATNDASGAA